jgi:membrane protease YdiL (CAAX protease family)
MNSRFLEYLGYNQLEPLIAISTLTIGFLIYLTVYLSPKVKAGLNAKYGEMKGLTNWVFLVKLLGFVLLGVIPALIIVFVLKQPLARYGAGPMTATGWYWMIGLSLFVLILNILQGRRPANYDIYPLIREKEWSTGLVAASGITSTLFIVGYEFMFRGFLLYSCIPLMGVEVAIAVNVIIYSFAHIHKGMQETIGSVPFGILLCYITLTTGSFWAIMVAHSILSLSADFVGLYANPEMRFKGKR